MSRMRLVLALTAALGAGALAAPASAAPMMLDPGVATAADLAQAKPEAVRWVCNAWGRCWNRPSYGYRPYYAPRFYGGGGYRRGWGGGRGWGHRGWGRRW